MHVTEIFAFGDIYFRRPVFIFFSVCICDIVAKWRLHGWQYVFPVLLLLYMGKRRQLVGAESLCQKVTQHDGRACIYHSARTMNNGGIMATVDGDLRISIVAHIDGLLCLINRCRGLDDTGKAQWHTIGNAAVDAAVVIGVDVYKRQAVGDAKREESNL